MKKKKLFLLLIALLSVVAQSSWAQSGTISYIERSWDAVNNSVVETTRTLTAGDYTLLSSDLFDDDGDINLNEGNYVLKEDLTVPGRILLRGKENCTFNIILCDGATMKLLGVIFDENTTLNRTLNFFGQTNDTGKLICGSYKTWTPAIGDVFGTNGTINIHGGNLKAEGGRYSPAIGMAELYVREEKTGIYGSLASINIFGGIIDATGGVSSAGIGGGASIKNYGTINIYGGRITAEGGIKGLFSSSSGAGIGGGLYNQEGSLNIYGGFIQATGGEEAAGIGCGAGGGMSDHDSDYGPGTITISGGTVYAYGGEYAAGIGAGDGVNGRLVVITGGHVEAYAGVDAAGIGGGEGGDGGTVIISGGYVYAQGNDYGAGIGGGEDGYGGNITIEGGTVIAKAGRQGETGNRAFGPGNGCNDYGWLNIGNKMMVQAGNNYNNYERIFTAAERQNACWYRSSARVEPCTHPDATYTVSGTTANDTHTKHCNYCKTHFEAEKHDFKNNKCSVCGIEAASFSVRIFLPKDQGNGTYDGKTYDGSTVMKMVPNTTFTLPGSPTTVPGLEFVGWEVSSVTGTTYTSSYTSTGGTVIEAEAEYTITADVSFVARYKQLNIILAANGDNHEKLHKYNTMTANSVTLEGHTFLMDGIWNTICLPFSLTEAEVNHYLRGAVLKTLSSSSFAGGTLTLNFEDATSIEAGRPYILKWDNVTGWMSNPVFKNVTIDNTLKPVETQYFNFIGCFSPEHLTENDITVLYLGDDNSLFYSNEAKTFDAFRAYFKVNINLGDVNGDESIDVTDVTMLVNYILGNTNGGFIVDNADINQDGEIDVTDVTALVNIILGDKGFNVVVNGAEGLTFGGSASVGAK